MNKSHQGIQTKKNIIKKYLLILLAGIILFFFVLFLIKQYQKIPINYKSLLYDKTKDIVYSIADDSIKEGDKLPYININNKNIDKINDDIINSYYDYLGKFTNGYTYEYNVSGNILSILIKSYQRYNDSEHYDIVYRTYNINLKTYKVLTEKELLEKYNITEEKLSYFIAYKFSNYYKDLLEKKYFKERECDYNCFLDSKGIDDFLADNYYYINNNHLELYKYFNIYTEYNEQNYFTEDSFHFVIK